MYPLSNQKIVGSCSPNLPLDKIQYAHNVNIYLATDFSGQSFNPKISAAGSDYNSLLCSAGYKNTSSELSEPVIVGLPPPSSLVSQVILLV